MMRIDHECGPNVRRTLTRDPRVGIDGTFLCRSEEETFPTRSVATLEDRLRTLYQKATGRQIANLSDQPRLVTGCISVSSVSNPVPFCPFWGQEVSAGSGPLVPASLLYSHIGCSTAATQRRLPNTL